MDTRTRDRSLLPAAGSRPIVRSLPTDATDAAAARPRPKWDMPLIVPFHVNEHWYEDTWYRVAPQPRSRPTVAFLRLLIGRLMVVRARLAWWFTWRNRHRGAAKQAAL